MAKPPNVWPNGGKSAEIRVSNSPFSINNLFWWLSRGLGLAAFSDDGLVEFTAETIRKFVKLVITIDLNGLLGGVQDHVAIAAPLKMLFQLCSYFHLDSAIQIIGQLFKKIFAFHGWPSPPLFDLKYFARRSLSCKRARKRRDFTAGMLNPSISAVSSVESPSTSRRTKTVLKPGGSP